jgi:hypothetical protein
VYGNAFGDSMQLPTEYASEYPSFYPQVPRMAERVVTLENTNPFVDDTQRDTTHPRLVQRFVPQPTSDRVEVNAFIKVSFDFTVNGRKQQRPMEAIMPLRYTYRSSASMRTTANRQKPHQVAPLLPPDFGGPAFTNAIDRQLFHFCEFN